jgi:hypothetical protein
MNNFVAAFTAGFVATIVLTVVMVIQSLLGLAPQADYIGMVTQFANERMQLQPSYPAAGWVINYFVGVVIYGACFSLYNYLVPKHRAVVNGIILSTIFWIIMMLIIMPTLGYGLFGITAGAVVPVVTLIHHFIFGAVLGLVYEKLHNPDADNLT